MLDQLIQFAKENIGDQVKSAGVDDQQQDGVFDVAKNALSDAFKGQAGQGNLSGLLNLFNGQDTPDPSSNPIAGNVQQNVISGLMDKLGLDEGKAGQIASTVVPALLNRFASKETGTANDGGDLLKQLGFDGGSGGIMDAVKGLFDGK